MPTYSARKKREEPAGGGRGRRLQDVHAASTARTTGTSISVSATLLMRLVMKFSATTATISMICASLKPASLTAATSASTTLPRFFATLVANRTAASALGSFDVPLRFSAI